MKAKRKPSEVEVVAMAMYALDKTPSVTWARAIVTWRKVAAGKVGDLYLYYAREFMRALRKP